MKVRAIPSSLAWVLTFACLPVVGDCAQSAGATTHAVARTRTDAWNPARSCTALKGLEGAQMGDSSARIVSATLNAPSGPQAPPAGAPPWVGGLPALRRVVPVDPMAR